MGTQPKMRLTSEQYLEIERAAIDRSEFYKGEMFLMAGASEVHGSILMNLSISLGSRLRSGNCKGYSTDMRLLIPATGLYTYPDFMAVCGKPELTDSHGDCITNPVLIIEVLSKSTKDYDLGGKYEHYRRIPSLKEYVTIDQAEVSVTRSNRQPDGSWVLTQYLSLEDMVRLESVGLLLPLQDVYFGIAFDRT